MSLLTFFGCAFTAYGPSIVIFLSYIRKHAQLSLLALASAFFSLVSLLLTALLWYIITPLRSTHAFTLLYTVLFQELVRYAGFRLIKRTEGPLIMVSNNPANPLNKSSFAFVFGLGFGLMLGVISYITVLVESIGPGVLVSKGCPNVSYYLVTAILTSLSILHQVLWTVLAFAGYFNQQKPLISYVWLSHFGVTYSNLLNTVGTDISCLYPIFVSIFVLGVSGVLVVTTVGNIHHPQRESTSIINENVPVFGRHG
ncbi:gamma-secretase subunit Aph-1 [Paraphysoderma sedebokerense]|nr:gamma-secretase subunit Aph-1 [Paraphysoderma sedebokerense]